MDRREFGKEALRKGLAGLALFKFGLAGLSAFADDKEPSVDTTKLYEQLELAFQKNQYKKEEIIDIEVLDPTSEEAKKLYYLERYKIQKEQFNQRLFTHGSGAMIYFSEETLRDAPQHSNFYNNSLLDIWRSIPNAYLPANLGKNDFVVVDGQNENKDVNIFVFHTTPSGRPMTPVHKGEIHFVNGTVFSRVDKFPKTECVLWKNGEPIIVAEGLSHAQHFSEYKDPPGRRIVTMFDHPVWDEVHNRLVLSNGLRTIGYYDDNEMYNPLPSTENKRYLLPRPLESPYICDQPQEILNTKLKELLLLAPEIFTDCAEVVNYLKTGDAAGLKYLKLVPEQNPSFFIVKGGKYGFHHQKLIDGLSGAVELLNAIDPSTLHQLLAFGAYGMTTAFTLEDKTSAGPIATYHGIIISNERLQMISDLINDPPNIGYKKMRIYSCLAQLLQRAYEIYPGKWPTTPHRTVFTQSDSYSKEMAGARFLEAFVRENYDRFDKSGAEAMLATANAYLRQGYPEQIKRIAQPIP